LSFAEREGNAALLPPVDGEEDPEGTCCGAETAAPLIWV